jgi:hypothetical protein
MARKKAAIRMESETIHDNILKIYFPVFELWACTRSLNRSLGSL